MRGTARDGERGTQVVPHHARDSSHRNTACMTTDDESVPVAREQLRRELEQANQVIKDAGAHRVESDGFEWIEESKLPADFIDYYQKLRSSGYALGAW